MRLTGVLADAALVAAQSAPGQPQPDNAPLRARVE